MKKLLLLTSPLAISVLSLLIVTSFLRYYLLINSEQLLREFKNQNFKELYSLDTLKVSSRMNALSTVINWVCIEGEVNGKEFYKMERGLCETGLFRQKQILNIPEANNIKITFTTRLPKEVEQLFVLFLILQTVLILTLIKSTRASEEEKRKNELTMTKLARQMSHDIRSPLATLNTVIKDLENIPQEKNILIEKAMTRIADISENLLSRTKINTTSRSLPIYALKNIASIIQEIIEQKKIEYSNHKNISISFVNKATAPAAKVDESELKRILSNLINNSIESSKNEGVEIIIELSESNNHLLLKIKDNGKGIDQEILNKLGKQEITSKRSGSGIGLIHSFERIKEWGGKINISSQLNVGTSVQIELPLIHRSKVILIDDDELVKITWATSANKHHIDLKTLSNFDEVKELIPNLDYETIFYIDSDLIGIKGELIAKYLSEKGFQNIYMETGHPPEQYNHLTFLKGVLGKTPPWN